MAHYLGADYGTHALRAAVADSLDCRPTPLSFGGNSSSIPTVVELPIGGTVGWDAYRKWLSESASFATDFRDELIDPNAIKSVEGSTADGITIQTEFFKYARSAILADCPDTKAVAVTVPDTWPRSVWSLPIAIHRAGWQPILFTREWVAGLINHGSPGNCEALLVSLGSGTARATLCAREEHNWEAKSSVTIDGVSGRQLRTALRDNIAEDTIAAIRRDPRESCEANRVLEVSVDRALCDLVTGQASVLRTSLFGHENERQLTMEYLASLVPSFPERISRTLESLLVENSLAIGSCPVIVWGELTAILPVKEWLKPITCSLACSSEGPLEPMAAGAARLAAMVAESGLWAHCQEMPVVRSDDGKYLPAQSDADNPRGAETPILESIPDSCLGRADATRRAFIVQLYEHDRIESGTPSRTEVKSDQFRLGRNGMSDWVIDARHASVSAAHAVITREGRNYKIVDLDSLNGTYVNGQPVRKTSLLRHGDVVSLGRTGPRFRFEMA